jgi:hypothetical protein
MMERVLTQLTDKLQKTFADALISVVLYGSAAAGDDDRKFSDLNILCVLRQVTPAEMGKSEPIFRWWREQGNPSPLLLSDQEVRTCTDCFAIEFHDIKRKHRVLCGTDVLESLELDDSFYRAQVEFQLRAKLLRLRQKASGVLSDKDLLRQLLLDSLSTFCVLFSHSLLLNGVEAGMKKREIIAQVQSRFGIDSAPFERLLDAREERIKVRELDPAALLRPYLEGISTVIDAVDRLAK